MVSSPLSKHYLEAIMTYQDLSGKKRPRRFVIAAVVILAIIGIVFTGSQIQRSAARSEVMATPKPLEDEIPTWTPPPANPPSTPTPTELPCPTDASEWALVDFMLDGNLRAIEPACAYASLNPVLTWHLLTHRGYRGQEAAELLGFDDVPVGPRRDSIGGITSTGDPQQIPLTHSPTTFHPDYAYSLVDGAGHPIDLAYSLRGCNRPFAIVGGKIEDWGTGYDLICTFALDQMAGWIVHQMDDLIFSVEVPALRQFYLVGYTESQWELIGGFKDLVSLIEDDDAFAQDRADYALYTGWDKARIENPGFEAIPLPSNWQSRNDPAVLQEIISRLEREQ